MEPEDVAKYHATRGNINRNEEEAGPDHVTSPDVHTFKSGAKSSEHKSAYHLIPWDIFAKRLAARYEHGATKYGEDNWRAGLTDREFVLDRANHMLDHAHKAVETLRRGKTDINDDDLAAVMWAAIFLMEVQARA